MKKVTSILLAVCMLVLGLTGCQSQETESQISSAGQESSQAQAEAENSTETQEITLVDQLGRTVTLPAPAKTIVSTYYISTASLIALGCEDQLVGIEQKADTRELYKLAAPQLLELPAVGSGKGINVEEIAALKPELVVIPVKLKDSVQQLEALDIPVLVVNPETQEDFEGCLQLLAQATGNQERGEQLLAYYAEQMQAMQTLTKDLDKPSVYIAGSGSWLRTCTADMYQNTLIEVAGGQNASAELTGGSWSEISAEQLLGWNPEYMFAVNYAEYSLDDVKNDAALTNVQAVENDRLGIFPSEIEPWDYPTPSSVLGALWLTHQLHPETYTKEAYVQEAQNFYKTYFDITVTEQQLGIHE